MTDGGNDLRQAADAREGEWLVSVLRGQPWATVASVLPPVFDAYARIFHPAFRSVGNSMVPVSWTEVAIANRRGMHAGVEWGSLTGSWQLQGQPGIWDQEPSTGDLPEPVAKTLVPLLEEQTVSAARCFFGLFRSGETHVAFSFKHDIPLEDRQKIEGEARAELECWRVLLRSAPELDAPQREMRLLEGPLRAFPEFYRAHREPPHLWWPADRAWAVATDVDLMTTYVGGSRACIDTLLREPRLEILEIDADQRVDWEADSINPLPAPPQEALRPNDN
jgi:hypothetical protein